MTKSRTLKPSVPHPGLFPIKISVNPSKPLEYRKGFMKPREGKPFDSRTLLRRLTMPANVGADAEVPPTSPDSPPTKIRKLSP